MRIIFKINLIIYLQKLIKVLFLCALILHLIKTTVEYAKFEYDIKLFIDNNMIKFPIISLCVALLRSLSAY